MTKPKPESDIENLYKSLSTHQLRLVRQAFSHDLESTSAEKDRAFARSRIEIIDRVLAARTTPSA